jgi:hypothetical protein
MVVLFGIQVLGIAFGLFMFYLAFVSFKRRDLSRAGFALWGFIWASFLFAVVFPDALSGLAGRLNFIRLLDLLMVASFMILFGMSFWMYKAIGRMERKLVDVSVTRALEGGKKLR